ncbi:MAG: DNA polymerase III subunit gamma/tau [Alphaproteobacteria bacterium]|nr:DNA polymerase III subunit gamma/tau [Alphaproteobacteria bacterium]
MKYLALARKHRPARFEDMIGQSTVVRIFRNALLQDRLHHAYLLCGTRGAGKTTMARLMAKAINCIDRPADQAEPCNTCVNCLEITDDRSIDVSEIDAASNPSVQNIRDLIEGVSYRAMKCRYRVYIIDEVHMLSTAAFNALLKTLEEPPANVMFLFATTEQHKIPATIISRCLRLTIRRIEGPVLADHLGKIARKEGVVVTDDALETLAKAAEGSVRDGLSLLDQSIALADGVPITPELVFDMLGWAGREEVFDIIAAIIRDDVQAAIAIVERITAAHVEPAQFLKDTLEIIWILFRMRLDVPLTIELSPNEQAAAKQLIPHLTIAEIGRLWQVFIKALQDLPIDPVPERSLEVTIIRAVYACRIPSPDALVAALSGGETPPPAGSTGGAPMGQPGGQPAGQPAGQSGAQAGAQGQSTSAGPHGQVAGQAAGPGSGHESGHGSERGSGHGSERGSGHGSEHGSEHGAMPTPVAPPPAQPPASAQAVAGEVEDAGMADHVGFASRPQSNNNLNAQGNSRVVPSGYDSWDRPSDAAEATEQAGHDAPPSLLDALAALAQQGTIDTTKQFYDTIDSHRIPSMTALHDPAPASFPPSPPHRRHDSASPLAESLLLRDALVALTDSALRASHPVLESLHSTFPTAQLVDVDDFGGQDNPSDQSDQSDSRGVDRTDPLVSLLFQSNRASVTELLHRRSP